ncbi:MAG: 30S ribosomal protein S9 [Opitutae bacterium]|nr:30S ribosomal protein S9 [Opitutae bacterium]
MNLEPPEITSLPFWDLLQDRVPELKSDTHKEDSEVKTAKEETTRQRQKSGWFWGTGRRKRAVARVRIRPGLGVLMINNRSLVNYFTELKYHQSIQSLFEKTNTKNALDVFVNVKGGGQTGQADAIVLGLARALKELDSSLDPILRANGYLTRDPRKVERKKPGQPGARKRFQFSKR